MKDNSGDSSEGGNSEEASKGIKKPRLGGESSEIHENEVEEITSHSEKLAEEMVENKDQTEGLKEEDKIFKVLMDMHEDVPLGDPGPSIARVGRAEGAAGETHLGVGEDLPLEEPGPEAANEHGGEEVVGATQLGVGEKVPLEDPGPIIENKVGEDGVAGATQ